MVDGVKGVDRAVLIRTSMGASRRSVKKRQVLSQSLAVHPSILSDTRARPFVVDRQRSPPVIAIGLFFLVELEPRLVGCSTQGTVAHFVRFRLPFHG